MKVEELIIVKLANDQILSLIQFLSEICKEPVKNWSEWGEEWTRLEYLRMNLSDHLKDNILTINEDTFWGLFNFLSASAHDAIIENRGENVFNEYRNLAVLIYHSIEVLYPDSYPIEIFVPDRYITPDKREKVYVDPNSTTEEILKMLGLQ